MVVIVEGGATAAGGGERLFPGRVVHNRRYPTVAVFDRDRDRPHGEAVQEVGGAVERVEHPPKPAGAPRCAGFLAHDGVVGALARERLEQQRLGVSIGIRDQVDGRRFGFEPADRPAEALEQKGTAAMGHVHRQLVEGSLVHRGSVRVGQVVTTCEKCENSWESCCKVLEIRTR